MITIDFSIVAEIICVLILIVVLNSKLYQPIRRILRERREKMNAIEAEAVKFEDRIKSLVEDYERKLREARLAGKAEFEKLKEEAKQLEQKLLEESMKEAEAKREELMSQLTSQIDAARKELQAKAESFAVEIAQKLLGRAV